MKKSALSMAVALALAALVGCGGGGGSGGGGSDDRNDPQPVANSVSGVAAKGVVQQCIVTAIELNGSGVELGAVGSAVTDAAGGYQLQLSDQYQGGLIKLVLTADVNTRMKCDSFSGCSGAAFGDTLSPPDGFTMNAVVAPTGSSLTGQITPLTHMVAARVLSQPTVSTESLNQAVSEVNQLVGINVQNTGVVDITDATALAAAGADAKRLALFNAGLADLIVNSGNVNTALDGLASSFADGAFDAGDAITINDILSAVALATDQLPDYPAVAGLLEEAADDVQQVLDVIASQVVAGGFDPEPASQINAGEVAQAKSLITDARSFLSVIADDYEQPMDAMAADLEAVDAVVSLETQANLRLVGVVLDQVLEDLSQRNLDLQQQLDNPQTYVIDVFNEEAVAVGTMTAQFAVDATGLSLGITGTLGDAPAISVDLVLGTNITEDKLTVNAGVIEAFTADSVMLTLSGGVADTNSELIFNGMALSFDYDDGLVITDESDPAYELAWFDRARFAGDVEVAVSDASFTGRLAFDLVTLDQGVARRDEQLNIEYFLLDGAFSTGSASTNARVQLDLDNATRFDLFAYVSSESQLVGSMLVEGLPEAYDNPGQRLATAFEEARGDGSQALPDTFVWYGGTGGGLWCQMQIDYLAPGGSGPYTFYYSDDSDEALQFTQQFFLDARPLVEASLGYGDGLQYVDLQYMEYENPGYRVYYQAYLTPMVETEDNFISGRLSVTAQVDSPDLPQATATLAINRDQFRMADAILTIAYDGQSYSLEVDVIEQPDSATGVITLSNADGVELVLDVQAEDDISGVARVGGKQVGTVSTTSDGLTLIRYNDGTFESLF